MNLDPETAERILTNELERDRQEAILREAKKIVREQRQAAIRQRSEAIAQAEKAVETARTRIELRTNSMLRTGLGSAANDHDVNEYIAAKARLAQLRDQPVPQPGEAVLDADKGSVPVLFCGTDGYALEQGKCRVCGTRQGVQLLPGHERSRLMAALKSGHGTA